MGRAVDDMTDIERAVSILRAGGLVAFPTETVYGLGADATNAAAVGKIYAAKGRPSTNPLIAHVADAAVARRYAAEWPDAAEALARAFWPGPLTLVLPRGGAIVPEAAAGGKTVALRAPDHPLALALLRAFDGPVAAPSANRSTRVSPTTARHVREELGDAVDLILDGGPCAVGIESTVLDLTTAPPRILRPGAVTAAHLAPVIGRVDAPDIATAIEARATSPGQHAVHYAPRAAAHRFDAADLPRILAHLKLHADRAWALLLLGHREGVARAFAAAGRGPDVPRVIMEMPATPDAYAQRLYATLRDLDRRNVETIYVEFPPAGPEWAALRDRLRRATTPLP